MLEKLQNIDSNNPNSENMNDENKTTDLSDDGNPNTLATTDSNPFKPNTEFLIDLDIDINSTVLLDMISAKKMLPKFQNS